MPDGLRLALTTFTVLPVRGPAQLDRRTAGQAIALGPLMGLLLLLPVGAVLAGARLLTPDRAPKLLPCVLALTTLALLTRGLHLDGLVDTADALASYRPPEQAREVAKSPGVGALGVATLVLVLLVQVTALLASVQDGRGTGSLLTALLTARVAVALACTRTPAAVSTGLGALVARTVPLGTAVFVALLSLAASAAYAALDDTQTHGAAAVASMRVLLAVTVGLAVAAVLRRHAVRRLGGLTGDVLGGLVEVTTAVVLAVMASDLPRALQDALGLNLAS